MMWSKAIRIDWLAALKMSINSLHSMSDGVFQVHLSMKPIVYKGYVGAFFNPNSPWVSDLLWQIFTSTSASAKFVV